MAPRLPADPYDRPTVPPPGPRWERLRGLPRPVVVLVSLYVIENSGIRLLAAILRERGLPLHEVYFKDWVNNRVKPPSEAEIRRLLAHLRGLRPDLVGVSVRASAFHRIARTLTERIRAALDVPVLWGGMHATSCPQDCAAVADLVAVGEAEQTIAALFDRSREGAKIADVPGLWVHTRAGLARNGTASLVQDLDALPFRDFHSPDKVFIEGHRTLPGDPYAVEPNYLIMASRGCPSPPARSAPTACSSARTPARPATACARSKT